MNPEPLVEAMLFLTAYGLSAVLACLVAMLAANVLFAGRMPDDLLSGACTLWGILGAGLSVFVWNVLIGFDPVYQAAYVLLYLTFVALVTGMSIALPRYRRLFRRSKGRRGEAEVRRVISRAGARALHDFYLEHDGDIVQIDHVVLAGDRLLAVETKSWNGTLYGKPDEEYWTQVMDGKSAQVRNPIPQNERQTSILRTVTGSEARGLVVFACDGRPPRDIPGVIAADELEPLLKVLLEEPSGEQVLEAWDILERTVSSTDMKAMQRKHLDYLGRRKAKRILPDEKPRCRHCSSTDVYEDKVYSVYLRCRSCGRGTSLPR